MSRRPLLALVGPTAVGKTALSLRLARALGAEIVSVDSMLVYRGMDVGTAKPTLAERWEVPHHLIDLVEPSEPFSIATYQRAARAAIEGVDARGHASLLVGGSGLYLRAVVDDLAFPGTHPATRSALEREAAAVGAERMHERLAMLDPVAAVRIEPANVRRTVRALEVRAITGHPFSAFAEEWQRYDPKAVRAAGLRMPRDLLVARIRDRVGSMLEAGWLGEVQGLVDQGFGGWLTSSQAIGYAELALHVRREMALEEAVEAIVKRTATLARRQMAWFRRDPRIRWFDVEGTGSAEVFGPVLAHLEAGP
jgi:tRNA dimethylallyltransferase